MAVTEETAEVLGLASHHAKVNQKAAPAQEAARSEMCLVYQRRKRCARGTRLSSL